MNETIQGVLTTEQGNNEDKGNTDTRTKRWGNNEDKGNTEIKTTETKVVVKQNQ